MIHFAVNLPPLFPTLLEAIHKQPVSPLPADAPSIVATQQMTAAFDEAGSENVPLVLLTNDDGLAAADEQVYQTLVDSLRRDSKSVVMLEDFVSTPQLREALSSADDKARLVPVGLAGELGHLSPTPPTPPTPRSPESSPTPSTGRR